LSQGSVPRWSFSVPKDAPRRCSLLLLALPIQARCQSLQEHEPGVRNQASIQGWQLVPWLTLAAGASPWALHKVELPHRRPTAACPSYAHNHGAWSEWDAGKGAVLPALPVGAGTVAIFNACSWAGTLRCGPSTAHLRATLVERSHIRHTAPQPALPGGIHLSLSYGGWARMATGSVTGKGRSLYIQAPAHPSQPFQVVLQLKTQDSGRFCASLLLKNPAQLFYCPQAGGSNGPGATF